MRRIRSKSMCKVLSVFVGFCFILTLYPGAVFAKETTPSVKMNFKPLKYFVPEKRIKLLFQAKDDSGVQLVRCYFRAQEQADFVFIAMGPLASPNYFEGILPAPSSDTDAIEYLFLVVNGNNEIFKTQRYKVNRKKDETEAPSWQEVSMEGDINVSTELAKAPETVPGFSDSIVADVVESSARFGAAAGGIYAASQVTAAGGTSGAAASATSGGTVSASAGMSTAAIAGIGVAAGAVAVGGAAAIASSDDNDDTSSGGGGTIPGACDQTTEAGVGGQDETHEIEMGQTSGTFQFQYQTFTQQDQLIVTYEGSQLFDTGCVGASGTETLTFSGSSSKITVEVIADCTGNFPDTTEWNFTVFCPE